MLGEIGRGESVGELAALTGEPRSATVVAIRDREAVRLAHEHFQRLLDRNPAILRRLVSMVVQRMRSRESGTAERELLDVTRSGLTATQVLVLRHADGGRLPAGTAR